jgi:hypothetical protein
LETIGRNIDIESAFVIGGSKLYQEAMQSTYCTQIIKTVIPGDYECDVFFPKIPDNFDLINVVSNIYYYARFYDFNSFEERRYLNCIKNLLKFGFTNSHKRISAYSQNLEHTTICINPKDLYKKNYLYQFPLMTTKFVALAGIFNQLIEDMGQYTGLQNLVDDIKTGKPYSSLVCQDIVQSYNFITTSGFLNCCITVETANMYDDYPNILARSALLLVIISRLTGYLPDRIIINIVDCYVFDFQTDMINQLVDKIPFRKPILQIDSEFLTIGEVLKLTSAYIKCI